MFNPEKSMEPVFEVNEKEKERESIERIENLTFLDRDERMELVLTHLGEKPSSMISVGHYGERSITELKEVISQKEKIEEILRKDGLEFELDIEKEETENGFDNTTFSFLVSKEKEKVKKLKEALSEKDEEKTGRSLGYPETACKPFSRDQEEKSLDYNDWWKNLSKKEKNDLIEEGVLNFLNFKLSKEHWREELGIVKRWQEIIKEKSPKLYQEIMKEKPWFLRTKKEIKNNEEKGTEKDLQTIRERVDGIVDSLGKPIEGGIKETVTMLNAFNMRTSQSCEGHIEEDRISAPWVEIYPEEPEVKDWYEDEKLKEKVEKQSMAFRKKSINLFNLFYKEREISYDTMLGFKEVGYGFRIQSQGAEILPTLNKEEQLKKVNSYRKEIEEFTKFLRKNVSEYWDRKLELL